MFAVVLVLAGCSADPPPPQQQRSEPVEATPNEPQGEQITVAVDTVGVGFNPHLVADQGPVTTALATMTLPSPFRSVQTPTGVTRQPDPAVVAGVDVSDQAPFTVTYRLQQDAQWSDGLPVTAEDFIYLWQQMTRQPGVIGGAGYRLIDGIESRSGGKVAVVRFTRAYPGWRDLFSGLLPSHALRGSPSAFQTGMDTGLPLSAGPFTIANIDRSRDEVRLIRNDRYWKTPAVPGRLVLRRAGTDAQLAASVRSGDSGVAVLPASPAVQSQLTAIPGVRTGRTSDSRAFGVTANTRTPAMSDPNVRKAVMGLIDPQLLSFASAGDDVVTPFANPVLAPSQPGYFPVDRRTLDPGDVDSLLGAAGFHHTPPRSDTATTTGPAPTATTTEEPTPSVTPTTTPDTTVAPSSTALPRGVQPLSRGDDELSLQVGVVTGDQRAGAGAAALVDQLHKAGIAASVTALTPAELYGSALTGGRVDLVVGWSATAVAPATDLASRVDCRPVEPTGSTASESSTPTASATPTNSPTPTTPGGSASTAPSAEEVSYTGNVSGLCDPQLSAIADRAIGAVDPADDLRAAASILADRDVYLPVYEDSLFTLAGPGTTGVPQTGPAGSAIFGSAPTWGTDS